MHFILGGGDEFIRQFFKERVLGVAQCAFTKNKDGTEMSRWKSAYMMPGGQWKKKKLKIWKTFKGIIIILE